MMILDQRIEEYRQRISEESNPVLKRLYEVSLGLLIDLKAAEQEAENASLNVEREGECLTATNTANRIEKGIKRECRLNT